MKPFKYKFLVIGLGNPLRGDDGLGLKVVENLKQKKLGRGISIIKAGTAPVNYLEEIKQAQNIIGVDAIQGGKKPGSIYQLTLNDLNQQLSQYPTSHNYSLPQVVSLAKEIANRPKKSFFYGIEPEELTFKPQLSSSVKQSLPQLIEKINIKIKESQHK